MIWGSLVCLEQPRLAGAEDGPKEVDLLAWCGSAPERTTNPTLAEALPRSASGTWQLLPKEDKRPGNFTWLRLNPEGVDWSAWPCLALTVSSPGGQQLVLTLREWDGDRQEVYELRRAKLLPGRQRLCFRLAPEPEGDLRPIITGDGKWNPDTARGIHLTWVDYPRALVVEDLQLTGEDQ